MFRKSVEHVIVIFLVILSGCIDTIDFPIDEQTNQIVIVGTITTEPGPYTVTINRSLDFYSTSQSLGETVNDATVIISSDQGEIEVLEMIRPGVYETNPTGIRGEIGRSYALSVVTQDGDTYQSNRQFLVESPQIDSIYFEYEEIDDFNGNILVGTSRNAVLLVDVTDDPEIENFYEWTWEGTYQITTSPQLHTVPDGQGNQVLDPLPCADRCECCTCWVTDSQNELAISNDRFLNGNKIIGQRIGAVPVEAMFFEDNYHVLVKQRSLTREAYEFLRLIEDQQTSGSLFATPPATIRSNFKNINDPDELVWGFFGASDISEKSFFIDRDELPVTLAPFFSTITEDCRLVKSGATNVQPIFWE